MFDDTPTRCSAQWRSGSSRKSPEEPRLAEAVEVDLEQVAPDPSTIFLKSSRRIRRRALALAGARRSS